MSGSKYSYAATQLETQGVMHPDYHMFIQGDFYQADPDVVAHVITVGKDANLYDSHSSSKYYCCLTRLVDRSK